MPRLSLDAARNAAVRARKAAGGMAVKQLFAQLSNLARLHPRARAAHSSVEVLRDLPYTDSGAAHHRLDIYKPTHVPPPWPVAFYVHGGGFRILSKDTHWIMGLAFARQGYLTLNINYRLAPAHPFPAAVQDAANALAWTLDNAAAHGGDLSRLVLAGESAGANLALNLAIAAAHPTGLPETRALFDRNFTPRAVMAACGIFEVDNITRFANRPNIPTLVYDRIVEVHKGYLGPDPSAIDPAINDLANPLQLLERDEPLQRPLAPLFLPCGTADPLVSDNRRLQRACERRGIEHLARYYPGEVHAFHAFLWRPQARACWQEWFDFAARYTA